MPRKKIYNIRFVEDEVKRFLIDHSRLNCDVVVTLYLFFFHEHSIHRKRYRKYLKSKFGANSLEYPFYDTANVYEVRGFFCFVIIILMSSNGKKYRDLTMLIYYLRYFGMVGDFLDKNFSISNFKILETMLAKFQNDLASKKKSRSKLVNQYLLSSIEYDKFFKSIKGIEKYVLFPDLKKAPSFRVSNKQIEQRLSDSVKVFRKKYNSDQKVQFTTRYIVKYCLVITGD